MIGSLYGEWLQKETPEDFGVWIRSRETTLEDLQKWQEANPEMYVPETDEEGRNKLPSNKQPGESCVVDFGPGMKHENARVDSVEFMEGKVYYNVTVKFPFEMPNSDSETYPVSFYNVDSTFVH